MKGKIFNIGSGKETTVNEIAKLIGGKKYLFKRPGEPDRSVANIKKIKRELNWKPKITLKKGVNQLLKNLNNWSNAPVWTPTKIKSKTKMWFKLLK